MESNGIRGRIHCSQTTADALMEAKKHHWITKRAEPIHVKGKGLMTTYWLHPKSSVNSSSLGSDKDAGQESFAASTMDADPSLGAFDDLDISTSLTHSLRDSARENLDFASIGQGSPRNVAEEGSYINLAVAERFEKTSILFGEVTGFSRWSVSRQPQQLFDLLEMILRKLAKIAKELGVNLEVIGNCYVASVGIPDPRPDHAVIMALFAVECIRKVKELTIELTKSFGEGTKKLSFRAGLHNGDAVAGVLKGPGLSNRFHLFGPNVDLAVRLQQSASKGQARCSKATADELAAFDKSNWVLASSVPLQINGSAEVETYVLDQEVVDGLSSPSHTDLRLIDEEFEDEIRAAEMEMKRDDFGTCRL